MNKVVPVLGADDYEVSRAFYVDQLGFTVAFEHRHEPGFPMHAGVQHGELFLHLSEHSRGHVGSEIYVFVDDIAAWTERFRANGVTIESGPTRQPWGNTEVAVKDPSRNLLRFSQIGTH